MNSLPANHAGNQIKNKIEARNRLTLKHHSRQVQTLNGKIDKIVNTQNVGLSVKEKENIANENYKRLIEEENQKKLQLPLKKTAKNKKQNINNSLKTQITEKKVIKKISLLNLIEEQAVSISETEKISKFALNFCSNSWRCQEHSRIKRWQISDPQIIRGFKDWDQNGQPINRYQYMDDAKVMEQRARHFLPGTERLLNENYRSIYTYPIERGVAMHAQLIFNQTTYKGVLKIGVDINNIVFHKYFEDENIEISEQNLSVIEKKIEREEKEESKEWCTKDEFILDISKTGILQFHYGAHDLHIFPIDQILFNEELRNL
ncbi:MAG: hypothetical protein H0V82_07990 [Candidatus Protochlamydia sp.]|nr:hypothetical protein [Candidatus Protochlamydia sp.]